MGNVEGAGAAIVRAPGGAGLDDVAKCIRAAITVGLRVSGRADTQRIQHYDNRPAHPVTQPMRPGMLLPPLRRSLVST
jgi:hypothetical protein